MTKLIPITDREPVPRAFKLLTQLASVTIKYIDTRFYQELRTSLIKYLVLQGLTLSGGKAKHSEIAVWTNTKKHNITALVDRMKKEQLVTTEWSQTDKRVNYIVITDKGRKVYKQSTPIDREIVQELMFGLSVNDARELERLLNIIKQNIERR
jgi:DNA-binding MarR family transcriptional regulator